jgi:hypothetical protein
MSDSRSAWERRSEPGVVAVSPVESPRSVGASPLATFFGALLLASVTFSASFVLMTTRGGQIAFETEALAPTPAATRSATPAPGPVRIAGVAGSAERVETGTYRVTFIWTLEGARNGDSVLLRFLAGTRVLTEQRGVLDATVFSSSTGQFTLTTSQECSVDGWSAQALSIRGLTPVGDAVSRVAGTTCR